MACRIPKEIADEVKELVFGIADRESYCAMSRVEAGRFVDDLTKLPDVGGVLADHLGRDRVRLYIKDAVLNRYSKDKLKAVYSACVEIVAIVERNYGAGFTHVGKRQGVEFLSKGDDHSELLGVAVATGTVLKWETALRKALLACVTMDRSATQMGFILVLAQQGRAYTPADLDIIKTAVQFSGGTAEFVD